MSGINLDDYIPVNERIAAFYAKHPEGSLQSELVELSDGRVVMRAYAYRTPEDARPGIGYASQSIPGATPYTRGSEVENCETSAWGRAIAALGFEVKRGIATAEDVQNKATETTEPARVKGTATYQPKAAPRSSTAIPEEPPTDWESLPETRIPRMRPSGDGGACPVHGVAFKLVPAGVSKKTGNPYDAFWSCPEMGCREKPAA
jgi:hypothetical protein